MLVILGVIAPRVGCQAVVLVPKDRPGLFVRHLGKEIVLSSVPGKEDRRDAQFRMVPGLGHKDLVSFESTGHPIRGGSTCIDTAFPGVFMPTIINQKNKGVESN